MHDLFTPDLYLFHNQPVKILKHHTIQHTTYEHPRQVYFTVTWCDGTNPDQVFSLENICVDEPWICICYANKLNVIKQPDWERILFYIELVATLMQMIHTYRMSMPNEKSYRYGVQVLTTPQQALELDAANGYDCWETLVNIKINQTSREFRTLRVLDDDEPLPNGYWHIL